MIGRPSAAVLDLDHARAQLADTLDRHHAELAERGFSPTPDLDAEAFDVVGVVDGRYLFAARPLPGGEPPAAESSRCSAAGTPRVATRGDGDALVEVTDMPEATSTEHAGTAAPSEIDAAVPAPPDREALLEEMIDLLAYQPLSASLLRGFRRRWHVKRIVDLTDAELASAVDQVRTYIQGRLQEVRARDRQGHS